MMSYWKKLAGVTGLFGLFIEGEGGAPGGGGSGEGGGSATGGGAPGGGGDSSTAGAAQPTPAAPAPGKTASEGGGAPISTQDIPSALVDETGKPVRELGESVEAFIARHREYREKQPKADAEAKTPEQIAAETKAAADTKAATEKAAAEAKANATKTPEQLAEEKKQADEKAAADAKAAQAASSAFDDIDFSPVPTEKLAEMAKDPEFQKLLEKYQTNEGDLFATSRLADKAVKYMNEFPTLESAQHAKVRAQAFHHLDDSFTDLKKDDIPGTSKFINDVMLPLSYLRGEDGKTLIDKDTGLPRTDGSAFVFLDNVVGLRTNFIADQVTKMGGEQGIARAMSDPNISKILDAVSKAAAKIGGDRGEQLQLAAEIFKGCGKAGSPSGDGELSEEVKTRLAEADRKETEANERQKGLDDQATAATQQRISTFKDEVLKESSTEIDKLLGGFLDRTSLKDDKFLRPAVMEKIRKELYANMSSDTIYISQRDDLTLGGINKTTHQKWVALNLREAKARLKNIADPILAEAGARKIGRAQERQQTMSQQEEKSRMESKGGTSTSLPRPTVTDPHALIAQAKENLRIRGEDINTASVLAERRKLLNQVPA